jgi:signal transduction histidine kinase
LFEKFFRADNVTTVETEGTGLGLYVVRLIVERAHGRIWFEPVESGGSRFLVALPLATTTEAAPAGAA